MGTIASLITSLTIVYSSVNSGADPRKHQSSASLASVRGMHRWLVNSPHKGPVTRKMLPFDDVIMTIWKSKENLICSYFNFDKAIVANFAYDTIALLSWCVQTVVAVWWPPHWITAKRILNIIGIVSANRQWNGPKYGNVCHRGVYCTSHCDSWYIFRVLIVLYLLIMFGCERENDYNIAVVSNILMSFEIILSFTYIDQMAISLTEMTVQGQSWVCQWDHVEYITSNNMV